MIFRSDEDVLDAISKRLRRAPSDWVWDFVKKTGWVEGALEEGPDSEPFDYLLARVRGLEAAPTGQGAGRGQGQSRELPPDLTTSAIVRIQAAEAARLDSVVQFRRTVLRGKLIKPKRLERWLRRREDGDGTDQAAGLGSEGVEPDGGIAATEPAPSQTARRIRLKYVLNAPPVQTWGAVWFNKNSDLRRLHRVVSELRNMYGWKGEYAVPFVLCRVIPPPFRGRCEVEYGGETLSARRIEIVVHPSTSPEVVTSLYTDARKGIGTRFRRIDDKNIELAVFVAERNDGRTWPMVRDEWIAAHPKFKHPEDMRNFTRDCRQAYRHVAGKDLRWIGGRTASRLSAAVRRKRRAS